MSARYASWHVLIDDIVFPDGRTAMSVLGGAGVHAVAGMRVWTPDVAILGNVGVDFEAPLLRPLAVVSDGIRVTGRPTVRAWQLFEEDGTRTQVPRISAEDWRAQLSLTLDGLIVPPTLEAAHFPCLGEPEDVAIVAHLAGRGIRLSMEPIVEGGLTAEQRKSIFACMPYVEILSPGLSEAAYLTGECEASAMLRAFAEHGPRIVALRQGAAGSLIYDRDSGRELYVPPAPANVVDVTGAGNAYCGGLLVGWVEHGDLEIAAAYAAVSAALTIEQIGPLIPTPSRLIDAHARLVSVLAAIRMVQGDVHA